MYIKDCRECCIDSRREWRLLLEWFLLDAKIITEFNVCTRKNTEKVILTDEWLCYVVLLAWRAACTLRDEWCEVRGRRVRLFSLLSGREAGMQGWVLVPTLVNTCMDRVWDWTADQSHCCTNITVTGLYFVRVTVLLVRSLEDCTVVSNNELRLCGYVVTGQNSLLLIG